MRKVIKSVSFSVTADRVRGQGRPRFGFGRAYKSSEDIAWEKTIREAFIASGGADMAGFADEVHIVIYVHRKLPKTAPRSLLRQPDTGRPDVDNLCKSVLDALNRVAFRDDSQVTSLHAEKMPRTHRANEVLKVKVEYLSEIGER